MRALIAQGLVGLACFGASMLLCGIWRVSLAGAFGWSLLMGFAAAWLLGEARR